MKKTCAHLPPLSVEPDKQRFIGSFHPCLHVGISHGPRQPKEAPLFQSSLSSIFRFQLYVHKCSLQFLLEPFLLILLWALPAVANGLLAPP